MEADMNIYGDNTAQLAKGQVHCRDPRYGDLRLCGATNSPSSDVGTIGNMPRPDKSLEPPSKTETTSLGIELRTSLGILQAFDALSECSFS